MKTGLSDQIRRVAKEKYVDPARRTGQKEFSIPVRGILEWMSSSGFSGNRTPQICESIRSSKFLSQNDIQIVRVDGPPSGQSSTLVVHYRIAGASLRAADLGKGSTVEPDAQARAKRLTSGLKGLLSKELAEYGGAEAFVRWIRSDDEEAA